MLNTVGCRLVCADRKSGKNDLRAALTVPSLEYVVDMVAELRERGFDFTSPARPSSLWSGGIPPIRSRCGPRRRYPDRMAQVSESTEQVQTTDRLWQEFRQGPFPDSLRHAAFGGTDVWLIELDIAGCVLRWLDNSGPLDSKSGFLLQSRIEDLDRVLPEINDPVATEYCQRLHQIAVLVSRNLSSTT
ncbi:hypothetical protein ACWF95_08535 [Streptomyces vinaceus]